jgi:hypothetical protein
MFTLLVGDIMASPPSNQLGLVTIIQAKKNEREAYQRKMNLREAVTLANHLATAVLLGSAQEPGGSNCSLEAMAQTVDLFSEELEQRAIAAEEAHAAEQAVFDALIAFEAEQAAWDADQTQVPEAALSQSQEFQESLWMVGERSTKKIKRVYDN